MKAYAIANIMNKLFEQIVVSQNHYIDEKGKYCFKETFNKNQGIYLKVEVDSEFYGYERDGNTLHKEWAGRSLKYLHVLMIYPHSIFTQITDNFDRFNSHPPQLGWKNNSNHDSCWRSVCSDELVALGFDCHDKAHANVPKKFRPSTKDENLDFKLEITLCGALFKLVEVETKYKENDNYFKDIMTVKEIKKTIEV